jgi:hypothetical protein
MSTAHSPNKTWYGTSSLFYFISRMNTYLGAALRTPFQDVSIGGLKSASTSYATPDSAPSGSAENEIGSCEGFLSPTQEEYFLNLYWDSYHTSLLVLNESHFKEHYKSLWTTPGRVRKNSALVDIVIAMSVQYGMSIAAPRQKPGPAHPGHDDATIAGKEYYRRCQNLLASELESPTLSTLQCQILSVIYLCCASFQNMAHSTLALAVRTAQMLGLHLEPPEDMKSTEKEMRRRLWWTLYVVETKTSMKLGREFSTTIENTTVALPSDDHETAMSAGSMFASLGDDVTWLSYNLQNLKMVLAARDVHICLYGRWAEVTSKITGPLYGDIEALEDVATFLTTAMEPMHAWVKQVPLELQTPRENGGTPLSTETPLLALEPFVPSWIKRQRLLLELLYHNLSMNLHRPMITFPGITSPQIKLHARSAVLHAVALTCILHQLMTGEGELKGWQEAFQWQWNAAMTLTGYWLAYPASEVADTVSDSLTKAIVVFDIFGRSFAVSKSAATIIRNLISSVNPLAVTLRITQQQYEQEKSGEQQQLVVLANTDLNLIQNPDSVSGVNDATTPMFITPNPINLAGMGYGGPMDVAFEVDGFNDMEMLWSTMNVDVNHQWVKEATDFGL